MELSEEALNVIVDNGFDPQYGARPLKRAIQRYVEDVLTEEIITNNPEKGSRLSTSDFAYPFAISTVWGVIPSTN